jgi:hypothetical protein
MTTRSVSLFYGRNALEKALVQEVSDFKLGIERGGDQS